MELLTTSVHHHQQWLASVTAAWSMANECQAQWDQSMAASRQLMQVWLDGYQIGEGSSMDGN